MKKLEIKSERDSKGRFIKGHEFGLGRKFPNKKPKTLKGKDINCKVCDKSFYVQPINSRKYCSRKCYGESKVGTVGPMIGRKHKSESNLKNKIAHLGKLGPLSGNWRGGIYPKNLLIRRSQKYKEWVQQVYRRDDYTCQDCDEKGGSLNAHHIVPFRECREYWKEGIFDVDNGLTLCKGCHQKVEGWN